MIDKTPPEFLYDYCNCATIQELYYCLSEQPNSIIIAQAAIESGWGTSRFFLEGFNLFGIHSFYSGDMKIKAEVLRQITSITKTQKLFHYKAYLYLH